jgi:hypothetical protein
MRPRNKKESDQLIDHLKLNRVLEKTVYFSEPRALPTIVDFLKETGFQHYGMRSLRPGEVFKYAVPDTDVIDELADFKDGVKICESLYLPDHNNLILQGYIGMDRYFNVSCEANDIPGMSLRHSMAYPKYKWYFNELEHHAPRILVCSGILDTLANYELFDVIVEFTYYSVSVGRNKEPLIIWEIRNY